MFVIDQDSDNKIICMAFVFTSQRNINKPNQNNLFPSPDHYDTNTTPKKQHECAPFRSTSLRKVAFQSSIDTSIPGPGNYEVARDIIEPNISSYSNHNNIIIKINSTGTTPFKSQARRFVEKQKEGPGPTLYQPEQINIIKKRSVRRNAKNLTLNRTIMPSIPEKVRSLFSDQKNNINQKAKEKITPGPGYYETIGNKKKNLQSTVWGKDNTDRFTKIKSIQVGPGQYEAIESQFISKKQESSIFKSGTVRTFFDSLIYESSIQYVAKERERKDFKSLHPAPGQYNYKVSSFDVDNKKPINFQFFGSAEQRFTESPQKINQYKGFYNIGQTVGGNHSFNKKLHGFNSRTKRDSSFLSLGSLQDYPGPGQYEQIKTNKKKVKGKNIQCFGSLSQRSPQNTQQIQKPVYQQQTQGTYNQFLKNRFGQIEHESSIFKSNTSRECFGSLKSETKVGEYDITYNDVAKKLERQRIYMDNLKKIQVIKPPFQSNHPRFPHYQAWNQQTKNNPEEKPTKEKKQTVQTQQRHLKSIGTKIGKQQRFKQQRKGGNGPEVGTYQRLAQWQLRSFNTRFQQV